MILQKTPTAITILKCICVISALGFILSCKKKEEDPTLNPTPTIELKEMTPTKALEFQDSITFLLAYTDGDGDLGTKETDQANLFIKDNRLGLVQGFRIPQLAPTGATVPIKGNLRVVLPHVFITDSSLREQSFNFSIHCIDRSGKSSNVVQSPTLTLIKP